MYSYSQTRTHLLTLKYSNSGHTHILTHSPTHTHILKLTYSNSHSQTHSHILTVTYSHSHTHTNILALTYSHSDTHTLILTCTYSHTYTHLIKEHWNSHPRSWWSKKSLSRLPDRVRFAHTSPPICAKNTKVLTTRKSIHHTYPRYKGEYEKYTVILTPAARASMKNTLSYSPLLSG